MWESGCCYVVSLVFCVARSLIRTVCAQDGARVEEAEKEPTPAPKLPAPLSLLKAKASEYPRQAAEPGAAEVNVRIRIEAEASVSEVLVREAVCNGFDEAAVAAVKQYRFKPAEWDGAPGAIVVEAVIHFVLEEPAELVPADASE